MFLGGANLSTSKQGVFLCVDDSLPVVKTLCHLSFEAVREEEEEPSAAYEGQPKIGDFNQDKVEIEKFDKL